MARPNTESPIRLTDWSSLVEDYVSQSDTLAQTIHLLGSSIDFDWNQIVKPTQYKVAVDPDISGWGTAEVGRFWINTTEKTAKYWDGSDKQPYPSALSTHATHHHTGGADTLNLSSIGGTLTSSQHSLITGITAHDWASIGSKPSSFDPSAHATSHYSGSVDALSVGSLPGTITSTQHTLLTGSTFHNWVDIGSKPSLVNAIVSTSTLSDTIWITEGGNISISESGNTLEISATGTLGVAELVANSSTLTGTVTFAEGTGMSIDVTEQTVTFTSTGGAGSFQALIAGGSTLTNTVWFTTSGYSTLTVSEQTITWDTTGGSVDAIIADSSTLRNTIWFKSAIYSTLGVSGSTITIGSTLPSHASNHFVGESDALSVGTPTDIGSTNQSGSDTIFVRRDHVHKGVHSISKAGTTDIYGDIELAEGDNIGIAFSGQTITLSASTTVGVQEVIADSSTLSGTVWITGGAGNSLTISGNTITIVSTGTVGVSNYGMATLANGEAFAHGLGYTPYAVALCPELTIPLAYSYQRTASSVVVYHEYGDSVAFSWMVI